MQLQAWPHYFVGSPHQDAGHILVPKDAQFLREQGGAGELMHTAASAATPTRVSVKGHHRPIPPTSEMHAAVGRDVRRLLDQTIDYSLGQGRQPTADRRRCRQQLRPLEPRPLRPFHAMPLRLRTLDNGAISQLQMTFCRHADRHLDLGPYHLYSTSMRTGQYYGAPAMGMSLPGEAAPH